MMTESESKSAKTNITSTLRALMQFNHESSLSLDSSVFYVYLQTLPTFQRKPFQTTLTAPPAIILQLRERRNDHTVDLN